MDTPYHIQLFGELRVTRGDTVITRFLTQKVGGLLACLALCMPRSQPREVLVELFWPDQEPAAGRNSLSVALSSLRRHLEPPGVGAGSVLITDRHKAGLNPAVVRTDVAAFEDLLHEAERHEVGAEQNALLRRALAMYQGDLLPGCYHDWAQREMLRLQARHAQAGRQLARGLEKAGDIEGALEAARQALLADPYPEDSYRRLMRLQVAAGRPLAARETYHQMEQLFGREFGATPSQSMRRFAEQLGFPTHSAITKSTTQPPRPPKTDRQVRPSRAVCASSEKPTQEPGTTHIPPGAASAGPVPSAIPLRFQLTCFFGRAAEMTQVAALLAPSGEPGARPPRRLVTLTGPGGTGKTRLAVEVARRLADRSGTAYLFVPLADQTDPHRMAASIAAALRPPAAPGADPLDQVVAFLRDGLGAPTLLLLDNLEQLLAADDPNAVAGSPDAPDAAGVVTRLLEEVPGLTCLCTSRRRLGIKGEQEFPLDPLPVPLAEASPERLLLFPSVQLYVHRAQAVRPDFQLTPGNAEAVAGVCRQMEGIPLAIELAAAWVRTLPPRAMRERLEDRLSIPEARERDLPSRHRSLRAALDSSFFLLSPRQQRFFARLSVFASGWTLEACEAVCQEPEGVSGSSDTLALLTGLQEASLVNLAEDASGEVRYRFLETIRAYASERLRGNGEEVAVRGRHRDWFVSFAQRAGAFQQGSNSERWLDRLEAEHANLQAALLWCLADENDMEAVLRLLRTLFWFWYMRGHVGEGRELYMGVLSRMGGSGLRKKMVELVREAGGLAYRQGDYASARSLFLEALRSSRDLGDQAGTADTLNFLGLVELAQGDLAAARSYYEEALGIHQRNGLEISVAWSFGGLGHVARFEGDYDRARSSYQEALAIFRDARPILTNGVAQALMLMNLGHVARLTGDLDQARSRYGESLRLLAGVGDRSAIASCLEGCACLAASEGQAARAARLFGAAHACREIMEVPLPPVDGAGNEEPLHAARFGLGEEAFATAWTEGRAMTLERAVTFALEDQAP